MREIKFRAWDKKRNVMTYYHPLAMTLYKDDDQLACQSISNEQTTWIDTHTEKPRDSVELMQYTGLKDKNGVEIYEGDIVKTSRATIYYEVIYEPPEFKLIDKYGKNHINPLATIIHYEVIGNIYEDKELLGGN